MAFSVQNHYRTYMFPNIKAVLSWAFFFLSFFYVKAPIPFRTRSDDAISFCGRPAEGTNEIYSILFTDRIVGLSPQVDRHYSVIDYDASHCLLHYAAHTDRYTHTQRHTHRHTHTDTHIFIDTHIQTHTHTLTDTHTHTLSLSLSLWRTTFPRERQEWTWSS